MASANYWMSKLMACCTAPAGYAVTSQQAQAASGSLWNRAYVLRIQRSYMSVLAQPPFNFGHRLHELHKLICTSLTAGNSLNKIIHLDQNKP